MYHLENHKTDEVAIHWVNGVAEIKYFKSKESALIWAAAAGYDSPDWVVMESCD